MKFYEVGGCVRDEILGVDSKDIDFTVVLDEEDRYIRDSAFYNDPFRVMVVKLESMGFKIFVESAEFLTARAKFPKNFTGFYGESNELLGAGRYANLTADFVLARKDGTYVDGRRPEFVTPGSLEDDLARRDFTMNAIAKGIDGKLIDPFNGQRDIADKLIVTVGDPMDRFTEDALRALRAVRFAVTKGFRIETRTSFALQNDEVLNLLATKVSDERKAVEMEKMFRFDTLASLAILANYRALTEATFSGRLSLDASMKQKGRGK